jgi:hypothetical protein
VLKEYRVVRAYYFLVAGTVLKHSVDGRYFVSLSDDAWLASGLHAPVYVDAAVVENHPCFRRPTETPAPRRPQRHTPAKRRRAPRS